MKCLSLYASPDVIRSKQQRKIANESHARKPGDSEFELVATVAEIRKERRPLQRIAQGMQKILA
jgi:hypothetical protein